MTTIANGGIFEAVKNPNKLRGHEEEWGVVGPYPHAPHVCATWPARDHADAAAKAEQWNQQGAPGTWADSRWLMHALQGSKCNPTTEVVAAICEAWKTEGKDAAMAVCTANGIPMVKKPQKFNNANCAAYIVNGNTIFMG